MTSPPPASETEAASPTPVPAPAPPFGETVDPLLAGFDHIVALIGYGLLFVSVFMMGVPALAAFALALAHRRGAHPLADSHFRFQIRIFYTALLLVALAVGSGLAAGGLAVSRMIQFAQAHVPALAATLDPAGLHAWTAAAAAGLFAAALLFLALAATWLWASSAFGFLRLLAGRTIVLGRG